MISWLQMFPRGGQMWMSMSRWWWLGGAHQVSDMHVTKWMGKMDTEDMGMWVMMLHPPPGRPPSLMILLVGGVTFVNFLCPLTHFILIFLFLSPPPPPPPLSVFNAPLEWRCIVFIKPLLSPFQGGGDEYARGGNLSTICRYYWLMSLKLSEMHTHSHIHLLLCLIFT